MSVETKVHTVPHFKASFNAKVEPSWLKHADIFTLPPTVLKTSYLVHKTVIVLVQRNTTVVESYMISYKLILSLFDNYIYVFFQGWTRESLLF